MTSKLRVFIKFNSHFFEVPKKKPGTKFERNFVAQATKRVLNFNTQNSYFEAHKQCFSKEMAMRKLDWWERIDYTFMW